VFIEGEKTGEPGGKIAKEKRRARNSEGGDRPMQYHPTTLASL